MFRSRARSPSSYRDAYVDLTGRVTGYAVADLRELGELRLAAVPAERLEGREVAGRLPAPAAAHAGGRYRWALARYKRFRARFPDPAIRPAYFEGKDAWL